jgi:hypothetical protein
LKEFHSIGTGEYVLAIAKDFSHVLFCYRKTILPFALQEHRLLGYLHVQWCPAVAFPGPHRLPAPIKLLWHTNTFISRALSLCSSTHVRDPAVDEAGTLVAVAAGGIRRHGYGVAAFFSSSEIKLSSWKSCEKNKQRFKEKEMFEQNQREEWLKVEGNKGKGESGW